MKEGEEEEDEKHEGEQEEKRKEEKMEEGEEEGVGDRLQQHQQLVNFSFIVLRENKQPVVK